jgi:hypothetical protein
VSGRIRIAELPPTRTSGQFGAVIGRDLGAWRRIEQDAKIALG